MMLTKPEFEIMIDFVREAPDQGYVSHHDMQEALRDAVQRLGVADIYHLFRDTFDDDVTYSLNVGQVVSNRVLSIKPEPGLTAAPVDRAELITYGARFGKTDIAWASATINPHVGCSKVSRACKNCYAIVTAHRGMQPHWRGTTEMRGGKRVWTGQVNLNPAAMTAHAHVKAPMLIFGPSLSDTFHHNVPDQHRIDFLEACRAQSQHIFLWLTKRPDVAAEFSQTVEWPDNIWLGTTIEADSEAHRADDLRKARVATRFISAEPLTTDGIPSLDLGGIDWLICGGESGAGAEPMDIAWARSLRDRCTSAGVAFFFKQWGKFGPTGARRTNGDSNTLLDGREWMQFPAVALEHVRRVTGK